MFSSCAPRSWAVRLQRLGLAGWIAAAAAVVSFDSAAADSGTGTLLYDANSDKLPSHLDWGWDFGVLPPGTTDTQGMIPGATYLDTTASSGISAGYNLGGIYTPQPNLDSTVGFVLNFSLRVAEESHANNNRAGFSIIVLDRPHTGIELGFWTDQVWAQNDDFTHGESFSVNTETKQRSYSLAISGNRYTLSIDGVASPPGDLRHQYSATLPFLGDLYDRDNYIFFGDNTGSAQARFELSNITLAPIPEPTEWALMLAGLGCVVAIVRRRRREPTLR